MARAVLALNIGSTSVKASAYGVHSGLTTPLWLMRVESIGHGTRVWRDGITSSAPDIPDHAAALAHTIAAARKLNVVAVGHRIVHGGKKHGAPTALDRDILAELRGLTSLAPNHQPYNLDGVEAAFEAFPAALQVACFDTAFHSSMPDRERRFALPAVYAEKGIVRYGFHGLSYSHIARILPAHLGRAANGRVIVAHLGAGVSLCAMRERRSIATTMGFTALGGLPMATRCGAIDPGVLLYLLQEEHMTVAELGDLLYSRSGLLGISGISGDMRVLLASADSRAIEAIDLFVYRVSQEIGSLAAALGGIDAIVFTGGMGENSPTIRERICERSAWLDLEIDRAANNGSNIRFSSSHSGVSALVLRTDEEQEIARETAALFLSDS